MAARVPALTGIRTLAALSVCLTHAAYWTGHYQDTYAGRLSALRGRGDDLLRALGYLLYSAWVTRLKGTRRRARVDPTYFAHRAADPARLLAHRRRGLSGLSRAGEPTEYGAGWGGFWRNMTFTQLFGLGHQHRVDADVEHGRGGGLLSRAAGHRDPRRRDLSTTMASRPPVVPARAVALVSPLWIFAVVGADVDITARIWPPTFFWWFVAGMVLAVCVPLVARVNTAWWVVAGAAAFLVSGMSAAGGLTMSPNTAAETIVKHVLYRCLPGFIVPLAVSSSGGADDRWSRIWASRPVRWFGEISHEFFCVRPRPRVRDEPAGVSGAGDGVDVVDVPRHDCPRDPLAWLHRVTRSIWHRNSVGADR